MGVRHDSPVQLTARAHHCDVPMGDLLDPAALFISPLLWVRSLPLFACSVDQPLQQKRAHDRRARHQVWLAGHASRSVAARVSVLTRCLLVA